MTRPLYTSDTERRQAGHAKRISRLERRAQVPQFGTPVPYALVEASTTLSAGPTADQYWFDMTAPSGTDFTNASDVFSIQTQAKSAGSPNVNSGTFHGLSIDQPGMYVAEKTIQILALYNDTTMRAIKIYHESIPATGSGIFGDQNHVNQGHGFHKERWSIVAGIVPTGAILMYAVNGEASAYSVVVSLYVEKRDPVAISL